MGDPNFPVRPQHPTRPIAHYSYPLHLLFHPCQKMSFTSLLEECPMTLPVRMHLAKLLDCVTNNSESKQGALFRKIMRGHDRDMQKAMVILTRLLKAQRASRRTSEEMKVCDTTTR